MTADPRAVIGDDPGSPPQGHVKKVERSPGNCCYGPA